MKFIVLLSPNIANREAVLCCPPKPNNARGFEQNELIGRQMNRESGE
jgi:hypothetical protein